MINTGVVLNLKVPKIVFSDDPLSLDRTARILLNFVPPFFEVREYR